MDHQLVQRVFRERCEEAYRAVEGFALLVALKWR